MEHTNDFVILCNDAKTRIKEIDANDVEQLLACAEPYCLIDVREEQEYQAGHLPNAQHLSKGWIEAKIHHIAKNKAEKIILYCGGGNRSALAADNLQKMGYKNVLSLRNGFRGWIQAGKSVHT